MYSMTYDDVSRGPCVLASGPRPEPVSATQKNCLRRFEDALN